MTQGRGIDLKNTAYFTMMPFLCMTIFCLAGGALSDRLTRSHGLRTGRCMLASIALLFTGIFLIVGSRLHCPQYAGIILALGAGSLYLSQSAFWSVSVDIAGRSSGIFSSLVNMSGQIGGAVTASLTPWLAQRYGWTMPFTIAAALHSSARYRGWSFIPSILWMPEMLARPLQLFGKSQLHRPDDETAQS